MHILGTISTSGTPTVLLNWAINDQFWANLWTMRTMRHSETSVLIYLHKRPAGTGGTNVHIEHNNKWYIWNIEYSWNKRYIKNFWNVSLGTLGTNGTYKQMINMEHKIKLVSLNTLGANGT